MSFDGIRNWVKNNIVLFCDDFENLKKYIRQRIDANEKIVLVSKQAAMLEKMKQMFGECAVAAMPENNI